MTHGIYLLFLLSSMLSLSLSVCVVVVVVVLYNYKLKINWILFLFINRFYYCFPLLINPLTWSQRCCLSSASCCMFSKLIHVAWTWHSNFSTTTACMHVCGLNRLSRFYNKNLTFVINDIVVVVVVVWFIVNKTLFCHFHNHYRSMNNFQRRPVNLL